jgi:hypothetical protein
MKVYFYTCVAGEISDHGGLEHLIELEPASNPNTD